MCTKSLHLEATFQIFFTSEGPHLVYPPQTPPFEGCIQVTGKIQNYWEKGNEQEVHLFSEKKRATNQQNRSI